MWIRPAEDWVAAIMVTLAVSALCLGFRAEPNWDRLADSILKAEGSPNYGILAHYRHVSFKQACINTCQHKYEQWLANGRPGDFIDYLSTKYCPKDHKIWARNVRNYYY